MNVVIDSGEAPARARVQETQRAFVRILARFQDQDCVAINALLENCGPTAVASLLKKDVRS